MHTRYSYGPEEDAVSVRHGLLALLAEGPSYGYQLRTRLEARTGGTWPLNIGQVYTTLARLERDGLVEPHAPEDAGGDGDGKVTYRITDGGRAELGRWFVTPLERQGRPRDELAIKLAMALTTPGVDVRAIVQAQRGSTLRALASPGGLAVLAITALAALLSVQAADGPWLVELGRAIAHRGGIPDGVPYASAPSAG